MEYAYTQTGQREITVNKNEYLAKQYQVKPIEVIKEELKYSDEYDVDVIEITIKNTSGKDLKKIEFSKDYEQFEVYNMAAGETYKVISFNIENKDDIKIISTDYLEDKEALSLETKKEGSKVKGIILNDSTVYIYPNRIAIFVKDSEGNINQKTLEYAGCFFEDLVINPNQEFEFEIEIPEGYSIIEDKGIVFKYSDLDFDTYNVKMFEEM